MLEGLGADMCSISDMLAIDTGKEELKPPDHEAFTKRAISISQLVKNKLGILPDQIPLNELDCIQDDIKRTCENIIDQRDSLLNDIKHIITRPENKTNWDGVTIVGEQHTSLEAVFTLSDSILTIG